MITLTYEQVRQWCHSIGADLIGVVPAADWAAYLPPETAALRVQSLLLFGAGGPEIIQRCQAYSAEHGEPEHWLSDWAQALFETWHGGGSPRYLNPYRAGLTMPFQRIAIASGLGVMGINHVVLNRDWGPWFSLLGMIALEKAVPPSGPSEFAPCSGCPAPCLRACPSGAVSRTGYDGVRCIETKLTHSPCLHACPARHTCVLRSDLRPTMAALEASRYKDDNATRALFRSFLEQHR